MLRFNVTATSPLQSGTPLTRMEFAYDGGGMGKGAAITLYVDGQKAGAEHVGRTRCSFDGRDDGGRLRGGRACFA